MKNLILGFLPVLLFWIFEERFGTLGGILAAATWSVGEVAYEWIRFHRVQKLTIFSGLLVLIFGGVDLISADENSRFFLFQPVVVQSVFIVVLFLGISGDPPKIMTLMGNRAPLISEEPAIRWSQLRLLRGMLYRMGAVMVVHCGIMLYAALHLTTGQFVFLKGPGLLLLMLFWGAAEFLRILLVRRRLQKDTTEVYGGPLGKPNSPPKDTP